MQNAKALAIARQLAQKMAGERATEEIRQQLNSLIQRLEALVNQLPELKRNGLPAISTVIGTCFVVVTPPELVRERDTIIRQLADSDHVEAKDAQGRVIAQFVLAHIRLAPNADMIRTLTRAGDQVLESLCLNIAKAETMFR